jgi:tRNA G18 (ribose-2'-O)-methylase SpoU
VEDNRPVLLVVGNEVSGIDPEILALSDRHLSIPMLGYKRSLNVAVAFGIAVYTLSMQTAAKNTKI